MSPLESVLAKIPVWMVAMSFSIFFNVYFSVIVLQTDAKIDIDSTTPNVFEKYFKYELYKLV